MKCQTQVIGSQVSRSSKLSLVLLDMEDCMLIIIIIVFHPAHACRGEIVAIQYDY